MMYYNEIFRSRTKQLAVQIIKLFSALAYSNEVSIIRKQIIIYATSVSANDRAVGRARSEKERFSKLSIVVEKIYETLFWLEIAEELQLLAHENILPLKKEAEEILRATVTYRKKLSTT